MSTESATQKWNRLLDEHKAAGKPHATAVRTLVQRYPALHLAMLGEVNADHPHAMQSLSAAAAVVSEPPPPEPTARTFSDPIAAWESALAAMTARGAPRRQAIGKLVKAQPDLHAAYVAAYNDLHSAARR